MPPPHPPPRPDLDDDDSLLLPPIEDPSEVFELLEVIGKGSYGKVYKARYLRPAAAPAADAPDDAPTTPRATTADATATAAAGDASSSAAAAPTIPPKQHQQRRPDLARTNTNTNTNTARPPPPPTTTTSAPQKNTLTNAIVAVKAIPVEEGGVAGGPQPCCHNDTTTPTTHPHPHHHNNNNAHTQHTDNKNTSDDDGRPSHNNHHRDHESESESDLSHHQKTTTQQQQQQDQHIRLIFRETRMLRECSHPNVVNYLGFHRSADMVFIVMEYCGGGSVVEALHATRAGLSEAQCRHVLRETLEGLRYLHSIGKLHRDIKCGNILLTDEGSVKLADFGVAAQLTRTVDKRNTFIGTPHWMAPEVIAESAYDQSVDVWALGVTALEMAETLPPHADVHPMRVIFMISREAPPTLREPGAWSAAFADFIAACLRKEPTERPSAEELLAHEFLAAGGGGGTGGACMLDAIARVAEERAAARPKPRLSLHGTHDSNGSGGTWHDHIGGTHGDTLSSTVNTAPLQGLTVNENLWGASGANGARARGSDTEGSELDDAPDDGDFYGTFIVHGGDGDDGGDDDDGDGDDDCDGVRTADGRERQEGGAGVRGGGSPGAQAARPPDPPAEEQRPRAEGETPSRAASEPAALQARIRELAARLANRRERI